MLKRLVAVLIALAIAIAAGGTVALGLLSRRPPPPPLPAYGTVPAFAMTDQAGRAFTDGDLRGRVWVASFIFTSCAGICPAITSRVAELARWLDEHHPPDRVRLVSISVDPARDTPPVLAKYAERFHASAARWSFLTGPPEATLAAVVRGFKIGVSKEPVPDGGVADAPDSMTIVHGGKLVLVDARGGIRGYYDADPDGLARLQADITRLVAGGGY